MTDILTKTHSGRYVMSSREPIYQLLMLLPLLVIYEVAAVIINFDTPFQLRNGADILVKQALHKLGIRSVFGFVMVTLLFVSLLIVAAYKKFRGRLKSHYFPSMLVESVIYAFIIGIASARLTGLVMGCNPFLAVGAPATLSQRLMIGVGAGVYEELVFRALLITALLLVMQFLGVEDKNRGLIAVVTSALLFSGFHYVGEFGEAFVLSTFVFRTVAGLLLSAIYVLRGIGVSAWSHALYDIFLVFGLL